MVDVGYLKCPWTVLWNLEETGMHMTACTQIIFLLSTFYSETCVGAFLAKNFYKCFTKVSVLRKCNNNLWNSCFEEKDGVSNNFNLNS